MLNAQGIQVPVKPRLELGFVVPLAIYRGCVFRELGRDAGVVQMEKRSGDLWLAIIQ